MLIYMKDHPVKSLLDIVENNGSLGEEGADYHRVVGEVTGREAWNISAETVLSMPDDEITSLMVDIGLMGAKDVPRHEIDAFLAREDVRAMLLQIVQTRNKLIEEAMMALNIDFLMTQDRAGWEYQMIQDKKAREAAEAAQG